MQLYIIIAISIVTTALLTGLAVQLIRIEKRLIELSYYIEGKVTQIINTPMHEDEESDID